MTQTTEIHGHEIMQLLIAAREGMTTPELQAHVRTAYGQAARFCTCSAQGMTLEDLLTFLQQRGKVTLAGERWTSDAGKMCQDGHEH